MRYRPWWSMSFSKSSSEEHSSHVFLHSPSFPFTWSSPQSQGWQTALVVYLDKAPGKSPKTSCSEIWSSSSRFNSNPASAGWESGVRSLTASSSSISPQASWSSASVLLCPDPGRPVASPTISTALITVRALISESISS